MITENRRQSRITGSIFSCGIPNTNEPTCSNSRHRHHLNECVRHLDNYLESVDDQDPEENIVVAAENLRRAAEHVGMITGIIATDEVLSIIFKRFCIGK